MYYFFYFPVGTDQRLKRVPIVTIGLAVVLTVTHYLLHYFRPTVGYFNQLILHTDAPTLLQAFTACFVHGDLFHLAGNLLYLVTFGPALEDRIGRGSMLGFYLLAGLVSMIAQVEAARWLMPGAVHQAVLGASGAISGLLGLFLVRAWFLRVRVAHATMALLQGYSRAGVTPIPAWVALGAWTLIQGIHTAITTSGGRPAGTAYWAHLSGLALGVLVGLTGGLWKAGILERFLVRGDRYLQKGKWFAALGEFETHRLRTGEQTPNRLGEARSLKILDRGKEAAEAYGRAFELALDEGDGALAHEIASEALRLEAGGGLDPVGLYELARSFEDRGDLLEAARWYEEAGRSHPEPLPAAAALERGAEVLRLRVGDLERSAKLYDLAAERLAQAGESRAAGTEAFRSRAEECRRTLSRRLEHAAARA